MKLLSICAVVVFSFQACQGYQEYDDNQVYQEYQGNQGYQGYQGYQGNQGYQGYQGNQDYQGYQGNQVYQGNQKNQDYQGYQGNQVYQGNQIYQGKQVYQGNQGNRENQANQGNQGNQRNQGNQGYQNAKNRELSTPEECARTCISGETPKTCYYHFTVEYYGTLTRACNLCRSNLTTRLRDNCQCIEADGYERSGLITANRMYPGPAIMICKHDMVVLDVENRVPGNAITIHFHGIWQNGYQFADGVPFVTQCPILEGSTFRYQWKAKNTGTHFWHAHTGLHKSEGLEGSLIVREPKSTEVNSNLWDFDNLDNIIYITDYFHESSSDHFPGTIVRKPRQWPDNFLINGKGQWTNPRFGNTTTTPLAVFTVKRGYRYRFRLINACSLTCPVQLTIQSHNLTVIASDGEPLVPATVTSITSFAAERYDFVINTNRRAGSYWIQARPIGQCEPLKIQQMAILRYENAVAEPTRTKPTYDSPLNSGIVLNQLNVRCNGRSSASNVVCLSQLRNALPVPPRILRAQPDVRFYLNFGFYDYVTSDIFQPGTYQRFIVAGDETVGFLGNITNVFPSSPLMSQRKDIPDQQICSTTNIPSKCRGPKPCPCTHVEKVPLNALVEIVLVDDSKVLNLSHPFHLHGNIFYLVGEGTGDYYDIRRMDVSRAQQLDQNGLINRDLRSPPAKDTYAVPNNGFSIIRFIANNPGYWLFHCHFEFHLAAGMATVFQIGEQRDMPSVPDDYPTCRNFVPPIKYENTNMYYFQ